MSKLIKRQYRRLKERKPEEYGLAAGVVAFAILAIFNYH
jgi:hypothetical protein